MLLFCGSLKRGPTFFQPRRPAAPKVSNSSTRTPSSPISTPPSPPSRLLRCWQWQTSVHLRLRNRYGLLTAYPAAWTKTEAVLPAEKGHRRRQPGQPLHLALLRRPALRLWPQVILFLFLLLVIPHFIILFLSRLFLLVSYAKNQTPGALRLS